MVNRITEHIDIWSAAQAPKTNGAGRGNGSARHSLHGIKKLRELILELAVRGKLVPQEPKDEPASALLKKIAKEKQQLIKEGKIKKQKPLPEISEDEEPFALPEGWEWVRLGSIGYWAIGSGFPKKEQGIKGADILFSKVSDMNLNGNEKYIATTANTVSRATVEKLKLKVHSEGTVIFPKIGGAIATNKRRILVKPTVIDNNCLGLFPACGISSEYEFLYLTSIDLTKYQAGTSIPALNQSVLELIVLGLPPVSEQHRIVAKVDELTALCDQMEQQQIESSDTHQILVETLLATLTNAAEQKECASAWQRIANHFDTLFTTEQSIDQLKQTILQLAVMGKLVPQDPNDLPAPRPGKWLEGEIKAGRTRQAGLPAPRPGKWFVYVLECEDGSLYKGHSQDILKRWKQHASGEGSEWTKKHPPKRLVHWEAFNSQEEAVAREKELKSGYGRKWLDREIKAGRTRQAGEPASVLLEKIAREKAQLIKEGKIKKEKPLPGISEDEKPFELPAGWVWVRLGDIASTRLGKMLDKSKNRGNPRPYLRNTNVQWHSFALDDVKEMRFEDSELDEYRVQPGDLLICEGGEPGRCAIWEDPSKEIYFQKAIHRVRPFSGVAVEFLQVSLTKDAKNGDLGEYFTGATIKHFPGEKLNRYLFPLPPKSEQHRIIAKVDELMAICDALKARLNEAQTTQVQLADAIVEQAVA